MGMIRIEKWGSFPKDERTFGPADHGHADVVAQVIEYLSAVMLPEAIALDHQLQADGQNAPKGWSRSDG